MRKKIAALPIIIALMGLYAELCFTSPDHIAIWKLYLKDLSTFLKLGFIEDHRLFEDINYYNVSFYALLLTGGIIHLISRKESRLIRFVLSVILLSKAIALFFTVIYIPFNLSRMAEHFNWAIVLAYMLWHLLCIWVCWSILDYYRKNTEIAVVTKTYGDTEQSIITESLRRQRFMNFVVDSIVFIIVFFPILKEIILIEAVQEFLGPLQNTLGQRLVLYFICAIMQIMYYMLFEGIFQATPGKLLTETRVVTDNGGRPVFGKLFTRTISRYVPFESLSVLFSRGWHDDWSDTYVVQEKREGVHGGYYFLLIPLFLFLGIAGYLGLESYKKHQTEQRDIEQFEDTRDRIEESLGKLTIDHVITISTGYGSPVYLKPETIYKDSIDFVYTDSRHLSAFDDERRELENTLLDPEGLLDRITLTKKELSEAILKEYDPDIKKEYSLIGTIDLLKDGNLYHIVNVEQWYAPSLSLDNDIYSPTSDGNTIAMSFKNVGWPAEIVKIENKGDKVKWPALPLELNSSDYMKNTQILGTGEDIENIDTDFSVKDELGRIQVYNVKGEAIGKDGLKMTRVK
jgi:uncharacterized RDD family membrane protein YckC